MRHGWKFATWFIHHIFNIVTRVLPCASKDDESGVMISRARFTRIFEGCVTPQIIQDYSPNLQKSVGQMLMWPQAISFFLGGSQVNSPKWIQSLPFPKFEEWNGFNIDEGCSCHFGWLLVCWVGGAIINMRYARYTVYSQILHMFLWMGLADHRSLATTNKNIRMFHWPKGIKAVDWWTVGPQKGDASALCWMGMQLRACAGIASRE